MLSAPSSLVVFNIIIKLSYPILSFLTSGMAMGYGFGFFRWLAQFSEHKMNKIGRGMAD